MCTMECSVVSNYWKKKKKTKICNLKQIAITTRKNEEKEEDIIRCKERQEGLQEYVYFEYEIKLK